MLSTLSDSSPDLIRQSSLAGWRRGDAPVLLLRRCPLSTLGRPMGPHPTVLTCRLETGRCSCSPPPPLPFVNLRPPHGVSRAQEPLAPARAFAGSLSLWTVLPPSMGKPLILATYLIRQPSLAGWRPRGDAPTRGVASGRAPIYGAGLEDCILFLLPGMTLDSPPLGVSCVREPLAPALSKNLETMLPSSPLRHWRVAVVAVIGIAGSRWQGALTAAEASSSVPTVTVVARYFFGSEHQLKASQTDKGNFVREQLEKRGVEIATVRKAETRRPHLPRRRPHCCLAVTLPSPPPTSLLSPLHRITVAVMIGVARVALAECLGGGSGILMGVVVGYHAERRRQETLRRVEKLSFSQSIVTQIVERCRCDVVLDAFCDVASKHIVFAWT
ncbi:hypothetical protein EDB85DRAFT_1888146 [Lactarius pseudohatsudake]|nr:hypothetical protein EDB85DRAFT_1888146 [Lactarius pseudohatsudake]